MIPLTASDRASIASIVRIPYAQDFLVSPDYMYKFTDLGIWSTVEIGAALSASSLATLKPLFRKIRPLSTSGRQYQGGYSMKNGAADYAKGRYSMPRVYRPELPSAYGTVKVKITSEGRFATLPDVDGIIMKKEISATDLV